MKLLDMGKRALGLEIAKRAGVFVYRPVLNADAWEAWAKAFGVPNPVPAAEMHCTIIASTVDVKMKPATQPIVMSTSCSAFALFGPDEDTLVVTFDDWQLCERNWAYRDNGAVTTWPTYRGHVSVGKDAAGFDLSDEALAAAPDYFILGGELSRPFAPGASLEADDADPDGDAANDDDAALIVVIEIAASAAAKALEADGPSLTERQDLYTLATRKAVTLGVAKRLAAAEWAPAEIKDLVKAPKKKKPVVFGDTAGADDMPATTKKSVAREMTMTVGPMPANIAKGVKAADLFKTDDELQIVYGWASVSTINGVEVEDLQGDTITVKAQREWFHDLVRGQRAGTFEHEGDFCNEVVEGLVLDHALQKSLGIDLGMEGLIVGTYVPDPANWAKVKTGDWMYSIAGTVLVEE